MEQEYQYVPCPTRTCHGMLRLAISEADYGRTKEATCPTCRAKRQVLIVDQKKLKDLAQRLGSVAKETLSESGKFLEVIDALIEAGFGTRLSIIGEFMSISRQESPRPVRPKVRDGEVELGIFSSEDADWAKELNIKLDN